MALAHSAGLCGIGHDLMAHLRDVAGLSRLFARRACTEDEDFAAMAEWAGWLHDLGKYREEFQDYLLGRRPGGKETQHAVFGAAHAASRGLATSVILTILGHHTGLPCLPTAKERIKAGDGLHPLGVQAALAACLQADRGPAAAWPALVREYLKPPERGRRVDFHEEMRIRFLFSCLVDADYLDTESHFTGKCRVARPLQAGRLFERLDRSVKGLVADAEPTPINRARRALYDACVAAAAQPSGIFRLTAPTGSGKTLAMLAFALRHAQWRRLDRIIIVLPFLAIIEQNARVYRKVLGADDDPGVLVEHHSAAYTRSAGELETESETIDRVRAKQAAENWDAPVIVTTAVQLLESLFANRPAACRKLHNIARSVVVFDEVQTLPFPLLDSILSAIRGLRDTFGVSFLLGSATQPGLERSEYLPCGFDPTEAHEIVDDRPALFSVFRRAALELPCLDGPWTWEDLERRVAGVNQALIIVNLRKHAQEIFDHFKTAAIPGLFHLSSTMCAAHRERKLGRKTEPAPGTIYHALAHDKPCVVVSTQVVEAGVDIDFPVVFRAAGPLDAIIQAAGRCDREGKLTRGAGGPAGRVIVFRPAAERWAPPGYYETATLNALRVLEEFAADPQCLLDDPDHFARYHQALIASGEGRGHSVKVQDARGRLDYPAVADLFRVIDEAGKGVVVPDHEARPLIEAIRSRPYLNVDIEDRRALQRFTVSLFPTWLARLQDDLRPLVDRESAPMLYEGPYGDDLGIRVIELPVESFSF